jgi:hypothetical protein
VENGSREQEDPGEQLGGGTPSSSSGMLTPASGVTDAQNSGVEQLKTPDTRVFGLLSPSMTPEPEGSSMQGSEVGRAGAYGESVGGNAAGVEAPSNDIDELLRNRTTFPQVVITSRIHHDQSNTD